MDIRQLELFCKVADLKSFSKAAEAISLTQPTASGHIKSLEDAFGLRLFDRLGREVALTQAGKILYDYAHQILALRQEAIQALQQFTGAMKGTLRLGGSTIPGEYLLPPLIGEFKKRHPHVGISLQIGDSASVCQGVLEGKIEFGVVGARMDEAHLVFETFREDELILVVHPQHPWAAKGKVGVRNLTDHPFILREEGSGSRRTMEERLQDLGLDVRRLQVVAEMGSSEAVREAVKAGVGASIISRFAVRSDLEMGLLKEVAIAGASLTRDFYIAHHKVRYRTPICQAFHAFLLESDR